MRKLRASAKFLSISALVICLGCEQVENPDTALPGAPGQHETRSRELQRNQFEDIPVPKDVLLVTRDNSTFGYEGGGVRVGRFQYWTTLSTDDVLAFYRDSMPRRPFGWMLTSETNEGGAATMVFRKEAERCDVAVVRKDAATHLTIELNNPSNE